VLLLVNLAFIFFVVFFQDMGNLKLLIVILLIASALSTIPSLVLKGRKTTSEAE